jgi:hypothetical protein
MFGQNLNQQPGHADRPQIDFGEFLGTATISNINPVDTVIIDGELAPIAPRTTASPGEIPAEAGEVIHKFSVALVIVGLLITAAWICLLGYSFIELVLFYGLI